MKLRIFLAIVLVFPLLSACGSSGEQKDHSIYTTPNGVQFDFVRSDDEDNVSIVAAWPTTSMFASQNNPVIPHIASQLMVTGGTKSVSAADLLAKFQELNANAQITVQPGYIKGILATKHSKLAESAPLANSVLIEPLLDEKWLERNKNNLKARVEELSHRPDVKAWTFARRILFAEQPIEQFWSTPIENIDAISRADTETWAQSHFKLDEAIISVSASQYDDELAIAVDRVLEGLPNSTADGVNRDNLEPTTFALPSKTIAVIDPSIESAQVLILGELPDSRQAKDIETLISLNALGQSASSRLLRVVREEQRATYSFSAGMIDFVREHRLLILAGAIDRASLVETLKRIGEEYEIFRTEGLSDSEFETIRDRMASGMEQNLKRSHVLANAAVEARIDSLDLAEVLNLADKTRTLGRGGLNTFLATEFPAFTDLLTVLIVKDTEGLNADCVVETLDDLASCDLT